MLPKYYKFKVVADAGTNLTGVYIDWTPYTLTAGSVNPASTTNPVSNQSITDGSSYTSSAIDNTSAKNVGGNANLRFSAAGSPTGDKRVLVYRLDSQDNTNFDDQAQTPVFTAYLNASGAQDYGFEVPA